MTRLVTGILLFVLGLYVMDLNFSESMAVTGSIMIFVSIALMGLGIMAINKKRNRN